MIPNASKLSASTLFANELRYGGVKRGGKLAGTIGPDCCRDDE